MALGLVGRKCGMTRLFTEAGATVPVTVIEVLPNHVTQVKTGARDGYRAAQVTTGRQNRGRIDKPSMGILKGASVETGTGFWEFRLGDGEGESLVPGAVVTVDLFRVGQKVDVAGRTRGKGFAGTIKRHHFSSGDATHGNSLSHRTPGSTGQRQTPGRVFKGKRMAGHLGNARRTAQNLEVVRVDVERNLLLIRGAVPGAQGADLIIRPNTRHRAISMGPSTGE
jgi:large subunit ribosomal protein L3